MPIVFFSGEPTLEQAQGPTPNSGRVTLYAIQRDNPLTLIHLGGHRTDDAPSYTNSEQKVAPSYEHDEAGRNVVRESVLVPETVKSVQFTLNLPNRVLAAADRLAQSQGNRDFDYFFVPSSCDDGCDEWFWLGEEGVLGAKQITSSVVGYDESEGPITATRTLTLKGQLRSFLGMEQTLVSDQTPALYAITIAEDLCGDGDACPYQVQYAGGAARTLYQTDDKWGTVNTIDMTGVGGVADIVTSLLYSGNNIIGTFSDVANGTGTGGGAFYSANNGAAVESNYFDTAGSAATPTGWQCLSKGPRGRIYAGGTAGELFYSENDGIDFYEIASSIAAAILAMDYDAANGNLYLAVAGGQVWRYNGSTLTNITAAVSPTGATDLVSVTVSGPGSVAIGGANGNIYETFNGGESWAQTGSVGSDPVHALMGTVIGAYRFVAGAGTSLYQRDVFRQQIWEVVSAGAADTPTGDIMGGVAGAALTEEGTSYYVVVTDDGEIVELANCNLCIE